MNIYAGSTHVNLRFLAVWISLGITGALLVVGGIPAVAQHSDPNVVVSELTGKVISAQGTDFSISSVDIQDYRPGSGEIITLDSDIGFSIATISFYDDSDTPQSNLDMFLTSLTGLLTNMRVVEHTDTGDLLRLLVVGDYQQSEFVVYVQITPDVAGRVDMVEWFLAPTDAFGTELASAQASITIDDRPFLDGVMVIDLVEAIERGDAVPTAPAALSSRPLVPSRDQVILDMPLSIGLTEPLEFDGGKITIGSVQGVRFHSDLIVGFVGIADTGSTADDIMRDIVTGMQRADPSLVSVGNSDSGQVIWNILTPRSGAKTITDGYLLIIVDTLGSPGYEIVQVYNLPTVDVSGHLSDIEQHVLINNLPALIEVDVVDLHATLDDASNWSSSNSNPRDGARLPTPNAEEMPGH